MKGPTSLIFLYFFPSSFYFSPVWGQCCYSGLQVSLHLCISVPSYMSCIMSYAVCTDSLERLSCVDVGVPLLQFCHYLALFPTILGYSVNVNLNVMKPSSKPEI